MTDRVGNVLTVSAVPGPLTGQVDQPFASGSQWLEVPMAAQINELQAALAYLYEHPGDGSVDLSGYVTTTALGTTLASYATTASLATITASSLGVYTIAQTDTAISRISLTPGPKGDTGATGTTGAAGTNGTNGTTPTLGWSGDQITINGSATGPHLTGPQGSKGDTGSTGATGGKGDTGTAGAAGAAATIAVGTVTTGAAGTSVTVTNVGTSSAATLNFTIPQGAKGDKGDTGSTGSTGPAWSWPTQAAHTVWAGPASGADATPTARVLGTSDIPDLSGTYSPLAGSVSLVTLGTVITGTWHGTAIADSYIASAATWNAKQAAYTILATMGSLASAAGWLHNDGSGVLAYSTPTATDVGLGSVENTALSTWAGSTAITTLGTVTGTWHGTAIALGYGGTGGTDAATARINLATAEGRIPFNADGTPADNATGMPVFLDTAFTPTRLTAACDTAPGTGGATITIQYSSDYSSWSTVGTVTIAASAHSGTNTATVTTAIAANTYYRALYHPVNSAARINVLLLGKG